MLRSLAGHEVLLSINIGEDVGLCRGVLVVGDDDSFVVLAGEKDRLVLLAQIRQIQDPRKGKAYPGEGRWW